MPRGGIPDFVPARRRPAPSVGSGGSFVCLHRHDTTEPSQCSCTASASSPPCRPCPRRPRSGGRATTTGGHATTTRPPPHGRHPGQRADPAPHRPATGAAVTGRSVAGDRAHAALGADRRWHRRPGRRRRRPRNRSPWRSRRRAARRRGTGSRSATPATRRWTPRCGRSCRPASTTTAISGGGRATRRRRVGHRGDLAAAAARAQHHHAGHRARRDRAGPAADRADLRVHQRRQPAVRLRHGHLAGGARHRRPR